MVATYNFGSVYIACKIYLSPSVASADVHSKVVFLLLLIHYLLLGLCLVLAFQSSTW